MTVRTSVAMRVRTVPSAAWTMALAFAQPRDARRYGAAQRRTVAAAIATWPLHALVILFSCLSRCAFSTRDGHIAMLLTRTGAKTSLKQVGVLVIVVATSTAALMLGGQLLFGAAAESLGLVAGTLVMAWIVVGAIVVASRGRDSLGNNRELRLVRKPFWLLASVARRPEDRLNAFDFAASVVRAAVPHGARVAVVASDQRRARVYERLGFRRVRDPEGLTLIWTSP